MSALIVAAVLTTEIPKPKSRTPADAHNSHFVLKGILLTIRCPGAFLGMSGFITKIIFKIVSEL